MEETLFHLSQLARNTDHIPGVVVKRFCSGFLD
jgi:hypothetical protein